MTETNIVYNYYFSPFLYFCLRDRRKKQNKKLYKLLVVFVFTFYSHLRFIHIFWNTHLTNENIKTKHLKMKI